MDLLAAIWMLAPAFVLPLAFINMCCCGGDCEACTTAITAQLQVTISGVADISPTPQCDGCANVNGVWLTTHLAPPEGGGLFCSHADHNGAQACWWYEFDATVHVVCNEEPDENCGSFVTVRLIKSTFPTTSYSMDISAAAPCRDRVGDPSICENPGGFGVTWFKSFGSSQPNCNTFSGLDVPTNTESGCDVTPSTCTVDSV